MRRAQSASSSTSFTTRCGNGSVRTSAGPTPARSDCIAPSYERSGGLASLRTCLLWGRVVAVEAPRKTLCFDLDGTLCSATARDYEQAEPFPWAIARVNRLAREGHTIIIMT